MYAAKAVTAFVAAIVTVLGVVFMDNQVDQSEISSTVAVIVDAVLVLLSALGVYAVPNRGAPVPPAQ